MCRKRRYSI